MSNKNTLPEVGCVVLARVLRVRARGVDVGVVVVYPRRDGGEGGGEGNGGGKGKEGVFEGTGGDGGDGHGEGDGGSVCGEEWAGVIRREDVRATEKDRVVCQEGFRVGDVVRGVVVCDVSSFDLVFLFFFWDMVCTGLCCSAFWILLFREGAGGRELMLMACIQISLGDQSNYYLTTAKNELGVIMAKSEAGNTMVPISWREFRDPVTGARESRKVAKPF